MPECFSVGNPKPTIDEVVVEISKWLRDPAALAAATAELDALRSRIHSTGATRRTADVIIGWLEKSANTDSTAAAA